ncbi:hypothetical protein LPY66_12585 [Dehalobacter sp. DCM]|uniref:hypothetical protein n=1 Tax=Dehalobacter sp. DCM TaxID=2907827 RepID=UPI003081CAD5|nr:hypothetical protein LPY66_12585 [Dehalobacter sp. DCM]
MKKHWLALFGEKEIIAARVALSKDGDLQVLFLAKYRAPGGKDIDYRDVAGSDWEAVKNWFRYQRIPVKNIKIAVSGKGLVMTVMSLPQMTLADLSKIMTGDMDRFFEPDGQNYVIDYRVVADYEENGRPMIKVLLAAFPKERMADLLAFCSKLGIQTTIDLAANDMITIYSYLLERINFPVSTVIEKPSLKDIAVVVLNPGLVEFVLFTNGSVDMYTNMRPDQEDIAIADQNRQNAAQAAIKQNPTWQHESHESYESHESEELPMLSFYKNDPQPDTTTGLSLEEMEAAEAYYTKIDSTKSANKDFVLEDLFVPYDQLDEKLFILTTQEHPEATMGGLGPIDENTALDDNKASEENKQADDDNESKEYDFARVVSSLNKLLEVYAQRHNGKIIDAVYLTGEYCQNPGITEQFVDKLSRTVITGFPGNWFPRFKDSIATRESWPQYAAIYGLALSNESNRFQFAEKPSQSLPPLPPSQPSPQQEAEPQQSIKQNKYKRLRHVICSVFVFLILAVPWLLQMRQAVVLKNIEADLLEYKELADILALNDKLRMQISDQMHFLDLGNDGSIRNPQVIRSEIRKLLPQETQIKTYTINGDDTVTLGIVIPDTLSISKLKSLFEGSGSFQSFDIQTVSLNDSRQEIQLTLQLKQQ